MRITPKQIADLVQTYVALYVNTQVSPDQGAITGSKMKALEKLGLAYIDDAGGKLPTYRLTAMGVMHGKHFYGQTLDDK